MLLQATFERQPCSATLHVQGLGKVAVLIMVQCSGCSATQIATKRVAADMLYELSQTAGMACTM